MGKYINEYGILMELVTEKSLKISVIQPSNGTRLWIDVADMSSKAIEEIIDNAMKEGSEIRWYYLPRTSFEVIKTAIPPGYEQPYHSHHQIQEAMLVLEGKIVVSEERDGKERIELLGSGDFVVFDSGEGIYHTIRNLSSSYSLTLTFKFVGPTLKDYDAFSKDWYGKDKS